MESSRLNGFLQSIGVIATDLQEAVQKTLEVPEDSIVIPARAYNDTSPNTPASDGVHESDQEYNS